MAVIVMAPMSIMGVAQGSVCDGVDTYVAAVLGAYNNARKEDRDADRQWTRLSQLGYEDGLSAPLEMKLETARHFELAESHLKQIDSQYVPELAVSHSLALLEVVDAFIDTIYEQAGRGPNSVTGQSFDSVLVDALIEANRTVYGSCGDVWWSDSVNLGFVFEDDYVG
jgi:hypothetical protein